MFLRSLILLPTLTSIGFGLFLLLVFIHPSPLGIVDTTKTDGVHAPLCRNPGVARIVGCLHMHGAFRRYEFDD